MENNSTCKKVILLLLVLLVTVFSNASTRFRGPNGQGIYPDQNIPKKWNSKNIMWKTKLPGKGHSSPVKWQQNIYVTSADSKKNVGYLLAVHAQSGQIMWQKEFSIKKYKINKKNTYASPTPAVDSDFVYSLWFSAAKTLMRAFDHSGNKAWERQLDGVLTRHGSGSSPIVVDDMVIFSHEQEAAVKSTLSNTWCAFDSKTGKTIWELQRNMAKSNSQSTPCIIMENGKKRLLFTSESHGFTAIGPANGKVVWEYNPFDARAIASPVVAGDLLIGTVKSGLFAIRSGETSNATTAYELQSKYSPYVPSPVYDNGLLYNFTDNGYISCHNAGDGKLLWRENPAGDFYGSPILTNGTLYCQDRDGAVVVVKADKTFQLLAINKVDEGSHATPIVSENKMYLRTYSNLICVGSEIEN
jgi:outer membrane protein assembly factor BamB